MRHLVIDARTIRPGATGVGHFVAGLLMGLGETASAHGWRVTALRLASETAGTSSWVEDTWNNVTGIEVVDVSADYEVHPQGDWWLQARIGGLMKRLHGDVLVSPAFVGPVGPRPFARLLMILDTIAWECPGNYPRKFAWYLRTMTRWSARYADHVATISPFSAKRILHLGISGKGPIGIVPCGIDPQVFCPLKPRTNNDHPRLVYAASIEPRKNHEILFQALREAPLREIVPELVLLARANKDQELFLRRTSAGISIRRVEPADASEVAEFTRQADCAVFPSRFEGFGLPVIEAMACGMPLVASDIPTNRWLTGDGRTAKLVDPDDSREWAAAIADALKRGTETVKRAELGVRRAQQFTWQNAALRLLSEADVCLRRAK
ncbi:glycosyltransferase family 4 protein [bacterium]|nr:glycosyltransferase family 4 protein [bacterium]